MPDKCKTLRDVLDKIIRIKEEVKYSDSVHAMIIRSDIDRIKEHMRSMTKNNSKIYSNYYEKQRPLNSILHQRMTAKNSHRSIKKEHDFQVKRNEMLYMYWMNEIFESIAEDMELLRKSEVSGWTIVSITKIVVKVTLVVGFIFFSLS